MTVFLITEISISVFTFYKQCVISVQLGTLVCCSWPKGRECGGRIFVFLCADLVL